MQPRTDYPDSLRAGDTVLPFKVAQAR